MSRHAPAASRAVTPSRLYLVYRETDGPDAALSVSVMRRQIYWNASGQVVRYLGNWHKLHPAQELNAFLRANFERASNIVLYTPALSFYDPSADVEALPFILNWEPESMYSSW